MKEFALIVFMLLAAAQPPIGQACDPEPGTGTQAHAAMDHDDGHDCCDPGTVPQAHDCGDAAHCGSCSLQVPLAGPGPVSGAFAMIRSYLAPHDGLYRSPDARPLIRPPIA